MNGRVSALIKETLRRCTPLPFISKTNLGKHQILQVGDKSHLVAPRTMVMINTSATHRNPKNWKVSSSPLSLFDPERWLNGSQPVPGTCVPCAEGHRSCMGQRFAESDFCAAVAKLSRDYSVELAVEEGESWDHALRKAEWQLSGGIGF